jgi:RNA polymerase sigma factor (sigma-70 family)
MTGPGSPPAASSNAAALLPRDLALLAQGRPPDEAFRRFVAVYHRRLWRFFTRRTPSPEDAEELTQETLLRVYRGWRGLRDGTELASWLFTIATNVFRNWQRDQATAKRRPRSQAVEALEELSEAVAELARRGGSAEAQPLLEVLRGERLKLVAQALKELPDQMRRCAILRYHHDMKLQEIALVLDISVDTVKAHLYQARRKLRMTLAPYFEGPGEEEEP